MNTQPPSAAEIHAYDQVLADAEVRLDQWIESYRGGSKRFDPMTNMCALARVLTRDARHADVADLLAVAVRRLAESGRSTQDGAET